MRRTVALLYDFDKTLSPSDMQSQGFIQSLGMDVPEFWRETDDLAASNSMDPNLSYMYMMLSKAEKDGGITRRKLEDFGAGIKFFPGLDTWFGRVNSYAESKGLLAEHYVISSGLKEMIEGTSVAKRGVFKAVYASSFYYDSSGKARWPAQLVNYTGKTQFLFRIEKGTLDVNDSRVNDLYGSDDIRVPFGRMIYIGDSDTDIPCMRLVNSFGGFSIGVYDSATGDKKKVRRMIREGRISHFAEADYGAGKELERLVFLILDRMSADCSLFALHRLNRSEEDGR